MSADSHRMVTITRTSAGRFTAVNGRGGILEFGTGDALDFTPVELFLAAIGGCTAVDVDILTTRRAEPETFVVQVDGEKNEGREGGNRMEDLSVTFRLRFPEGEGGDAARGIQAIGQGGGRVADKAERTGINDGSEPRRLC